MVAYASLTCNNFIDGEVVGKDLVQDKMFKGNFFL